MRIQKLPVQRGMCCAQVDHVADVNWEPPAVIGVIKGKKPRSDVLQTLNIHDELKL